MPAQREGWDFAQLKTAFPGDPEFVKLARLLGDRYLAGVGLWTLCVAYAWLNDRADVTEVLDDEPDDLVTALHRVGLVDGGILKGFGTYTDRVRAVREANRTRQADHRARGAAASRVTTPVTNSESHDVTPREVEVEVERESENVDRASSAPSAGATTRRQRVKVRGFTRPFNEEDRP